MTRKPGPPLELLPEDIEHIASVLRGAERPPTNTDLGRRVARLEAAIKALGYDVGSDDTPTPSAGMNGPPGL